MSVRIARLLSAALIGACLVAAAHASTRHAPVHHGAAVKGPTLIWRGDVATGNGVVNEVAQAWQKAGHGSIELQPFNTASGLDAVSTGAADLAGSARSSSGSAEDANLTFTPVAWDALVIIVQASNPVHSLTLKQVHDIYYGKITNWSEVGGSNAPIDVYAVASPADGVEYSLRTLLFGRGNQPVAAPRLYVNMRKLEEGVSLNPNGMGAATLADVRGNPKLRAVAINGVAPTSSSIASGSYLLFTPLYLVTNPRNPKAAEVQAFIDFLQTAPAQAAMRSHDVLPYQQGAALIAMDSSRRSNILAQVGAHVSHIALAAAAPTQGPGERADASLAAVNTLAAAQQRTATPAPPPVTSLSRGHGSVAGVIVTSLAHVRGSSVMAGVHAGKRDRHADANDGSYIVVKGDTLFSIARNHHAEVAQLREWNHLSHDQIRLGQKLRVSRD